MIQKSNNLHGQFNMWIIVILVTGVWILPVENARILAIETIGSHSRWCFMRSVLLSLTDAGHSVTVFTPFPEGDQDNYTEVNTSNEIEPLLEFDMMNLLNNFSHPLIMANRLIGFRRLQCEAIFRNRQLSELVEQGDSQKDDFDVIIVEPLEYDCISYIASAMNLPIIYLISSPMISIAERIYTGHMSNPAIVSHFFASHGIPNTFIQRFSNTALLTYSIFISTCQESIARFTDPKLYDLSPTVNPSIIFQNSHYITETSSPIVPNLVNIGGIHLKPAKSIPNDILDFIEDSPNGVIFFTFGSIIKMSSLPEYIEKAFKEALAQVPQRVLWKYDGEMKDKPKNVMTKPWFPQRDILMHPKIKLFISHGGMSGVYEAVDAGVPVLGFPFFYDQPRNIDHLVHNGMSISMKLLSVTKDTLLKSILELVNDEKYMRNAKVASVQFKDRPMSPQQSVVYWTEYVIRHRGAPHLRSFAHSLTWYQYLLLDVFGVLLIFISIVLCIAHKIVNVIFCKFALKYSRNFKVKSQ